jgi:hypothetical protein
MPELQARDLGLPASAAGDEVDHRLAEQVGLLEVAEVAAVLQHEEAGAGDQVDQLVRPADSADHVEPADDHQRRHGQ